MMKRNLILFITCSLIIISFFGCKRSENDITGEVPPDHPRILLLEGEELAIRETLKSDYIWNSASTFILAECDKILSRAPVERVLIR